MLIRVQYRNDRFDMVHDFHLEALIAAGHLRRFQRADGWVVIGRDPLRTDRQLPIGAERRRPVGHRPLDLPVRVGGKKILPIFGGRFLP